MVELKGSLNGVGLPAILQLIGDLHHTGSLRLRSDTANAELSFDEGHLVAAQCGDMSGRHALTACAAHFADGGGDFTFIELNGAPRPDPSLDVSPLELQRLLGPRVSNGHQPIATNGEAPEPLACPLLGFADDRTRHYGRATALHRCFASGDAGLVTPTEQRELCLSGTFEACPRYRRADQPALETITDVAPPYPTPARQRPVSPRPRPVLEPELVPTASKTGPGIRVIAGGVLAGLVVIALALLVGLPLLRGQSTQRSAPVAFEPVATPTTAPPAPLVATALARPTPAPTLPPTPPPPPTVLPTSPARASIAALTGPLVDVRFASGPADRWLDTAPYAAWSDGAYRLQAKDAARFVAVGVPVDEDLADVVVAATFRKTGGPPGGGYGLIVRDQGPQPRDGVNQQMNAYVVETSDIGEFGMWRRDGDHWIDLVPWTRSATVRPGGSPNELTVKAIGSTLTFTVNGQSLASVDDDTFDAGRVGLFVGGDFNEVALDRFNVFRP